MLKSYLSARKSQKPYISCVYMYVSSEYVSDAIGCVCPTLVNSALTSITFNGTGSNAKTAKLESSMVEVDLSGKGLGSGGAQITAAFLPKMT